MRTRSKPHLSISLMLLTVISPSFQIRTSSPGSHPANVTVTAKKTKYLLIAIITPDGRMRGGENSFCIVFKSKETQVPAEVHDVKIDFVLLVGKIEEKPIKAEISRSEDGRFCGRVNLGKQYYVPAGYYAFLTYRDANGKRRRQRLFVRVQ